MFVIDSAHFAGVAVGHTQPLILVIARSRNERNMLSVRSELDIIPAGSTSATDVIAERAAMFVRRHFEACHLACRHIDDDALDHRDIFVAEQRITPGLEFRMPVGYRDGIHHAGPALVLLKCRDLFRIGDHSTIGASECVHPALSVA